MKNKFNITQPTITMLGFINYLTNKSVIIQAATPLDKYTYNGTFNDVVGKKGDIIQIAFHVLDNGTEFVYYNTLNE